MPDGILVTGASGLLGSNFVLTAKQRNGNIIALYHSCPMEFPGIKTMKIDLKDRTIVRELIRGCRPDWIVHCAALTNVDWCETHRDETWQVNVEAVGHLASIARDVGAGFIYISTDSVFDGKVGHYSEDSSPDPLNVYAESKLAGEKVAQEGSDRSLIVRTNIYGWNAQDKLSLAEWILRKLEKGQPVPGFDDIFFTPILVNDLSEVVLEMMDLKLKGVYHVAGSQTCSKYEFALEVARVFGLNRDLIQPVAASDSPHLIAPRPKNTSLRTDKISTTLGRVMPDIQAGLRRFKTLRDIAVVKQLRA